MALGTQSEFARWRYTSPRLTTETQRHRGCTEKIENRERIFRHFSVFSVNPLCLCASVVNLGRSTTSTRIRLTLGPADCIMMAMLYFTCQGSEAVKPTLKRLGVAILGTALVLVLAQQAIGDRYISGLIWPEPPVV